MARKTKGKRKPIALVAFAAIIGIGGMLLANTTLTAPVASDSEETQTFSIEKAESIDSIVSRLKKEGLIRSKAAMKFTIVRLGLSRHIQAGEFQLNPSLTAKQIALTLTVGRADIKVTLIEGWRREEMAKAIASKFQEKRITFNDKLFLTATQGKEGYLFPDTYFFPKGASEEKIAEILLNTFETKVDSILRTKLQKQEMTLDQAVILASLIEREVQKDQDRTLVAGILIKRWKNDWPLQVDATVQYILGFQKNENSWWKKDLTLKDLETPSPYNTYQNTGFPPAPITNPSLASIEAVANQRPSDYWFYISDHTGKLHYAKTIEEHNQNIKKYLNK